MKASKRSRRASKLRKDDDIALDAGVWGQLQDHISLQIVYERLPYQELFRLRLVCKAWNHAALQRLEPKPYFVIIAQGSHDYDTVYLNGVLSYDVAFEEYSFKKQRFPILFSRSGEVPFEVEGLIFCHHPDNLEQQGVFNIHNKTWHAIPPAPKESEYRSAIGMMVDTSEKPYSFKLIVGSLDTKTQIYDSQSRSWTTTSSRLKQLAKPALSSLEIVTCMCSNGCVYISIGAKILLMYSMEGDKWTILDFPEVKQEEDGGGGVHALGVWEGRIFTTREDCDKRKVTVWELVDRMKEEWVKYVVISGKDYDMLMECDFTSYGPSIYEELRTVPCFCDGYLLMYNWHYSNCQSYALGMLNLATSEWEKVDLPSRTVAIEQDTDEDSEMEEDSDNEGGTEEGSGFEGGHWESSDSDEEAKEDEDAEGDKNTETEDAPKASRVRPKTGVNFRGTDVVGSKIAHYRQISSKNQGKLIAVRELEVEKMIFKEKHNHDEMDSNCQPFQSVQDQAVEGTSLATFGDISAKAEKPSSTVGNIALKPTLAAKPENLFSTSSWMNAMTHNLAAKAGNTSSTIEKIVMKPIVHECAMCFFESDVLDDFEAHKKTKVHRFIEELGKDRHHKSPLSMINEYISSNRLFGQLNFEVKIENSTGSSEVIAIFGGAPGGTADPPTKGFGRSFKRQKAKQMAAAEVLERIMENVSDSEFTNLANNCFRVGGRKRKAKGGNPEGSGGNGGGVGGNSGVSGGSGGSGGSGVGVVGGVGGNPGVSGGSGVGVAGGVGGNPGVSVGSGVGVVGVVGGDAGGGGDSNEGASEGGGNPGGIGGRGVGGGVGGNPGASGGSGVGGGEVGNPGGSGGSGVRVVGGNFVDSSSSKGVTEVGGNPGGNSGSGKGIGGGGGSYPGNPNAIPVTGYHNDSPHAGSLNNNVNKYAGQGGTGSRLGGRGGMPSPPGIFTEQKLQRLTESFLDRIHPGRGYRGGGYGGRESLGGVVGVGGNNFGGQDVVDAAYFGREFPAALGYGDRELHPGISAYGQQSQVSPAPYNIGQAQHMPIQNLSVLSRSHVPAQHISTHHVQTHHVLTQHVHTQQATMRIPMAGGPGHGGAVYSKHDTAAIGVATGTGQTVTHAYNHQYAPATFNYGAYAINQEYVANSALPVQEIPPGTSNAMPLALIAQYGGMHPQQQIPQQRVGYALQGATQHQQS